ncbi:M1 family aminopeptidase [Sediminitomix flava]|uniref:Aminopeptidase N n=1 Tax=Sediminitomix flava TaxID=379075 RepID=A0A315Z0G0_SEDFL|nr:M1 family aminopeptidase [Sediminitomix flava]PWJ36123.1 aminopeptidase N [Sediminitomix flava]
MFLSKYTNLLFILFLVFIGCKSSQPSAIESTEQFNDSTTTQILVLPEEPMQAEPIWASKKGVYRPERTKYFDLKHQLLDIRFDWEKQHVLGKTTLTLSPYFYPQERVVLNAKGFDFHEVALLDGKKRIPLKYEYDQELVEIFLDRPYTRKDQLRLFISYTAKPNERILGGSNAILSDKGLYFINPLNKEEGKPQQIWTQGETEASSCWFPTLDAPNTKMTQEVYITVQDHFKTLSNGALISQKKNKDGTRTDYWKQDLVHAPYLTMLAVGEFEVIKESWNGIPVEYYVEAPYKDFAKGTFGHTPEMLTFYSELFDYPYPWAKYSQIVVRDFVSGAMENTTATVHMEDLQQDSRGQLDQDWDFLIAHELIHHWFGNLVTCESWANLPLNESFANYGEYLWREHKYGKTEADFALEDEWLLYLNESESKQEPLVRYNYLDKEDMFDSHSYAKGGVILNYLRYIIGDEAFFLSVHNYLKDRAFKTAEIHHLRMAIEETIGEDMNWFFNQWVMNAGHPYLIVEDKFENGTYTIGITQQQDTLYTPLYRLPTEVGFYDGENWVNHDLEIDGYYTEYSFQLDTMPKLTLFDPYKTIPAVIEHNKDSVAWLRQFEKAPHIVHRIDALTHLLPLLNESEVARVLLDAMDDPFWGVREGVAEIMVYYNGEYETELKEKLTSLVLNDPKSYVRAAALNTVYEISENFPLELTEKALQDSSYLVATTALYAYAQSGAEDILEKAAEFRDSKNINAIFILADLYGTLNVPNQLDWYLSKRSQLSTSYKGAYYNYLGAYVLNQPLEEQARAADYLLEEARTHPIAAIRSSAYFSLGLLIEDPEIRSRVAEVAKSEKDPTVLETIELIGL